MNDIEEPEIQLYEIPALKPPSLASLESKPLPKPKPKRIQVVKKSPVDENSNPQEAPATAVERKRKTSRRSIKASKKSVAASKSTDYKTHEVLPSSDSDSDSLRRNRRPLKVSGTDSEQRAKKHRDHPRHYTSKSPKRAPRRERRTSEKRRSRRSLREQQLEGSSEHSRYSDLLRELSEELQKPDSYRSTLSTESQMSHSTESTASASKSRSRSSSTRVQFDGTIAISTRSGSERKKKRRSPTSSERNHHQRSAVRSATISKSSTANSAVDKSRSSSFRQVQPEQNPASASANRKQHYWNTNKRMSSNRGSNMDVEKAGIDHRYADERVERAMITDPTDDNMQSSSHCTRSRILWASIICCTLLIIVIPCAVVLGGSPNVDFPKLSKASGATLVSSISTDICNESVPKSGECTPNNSDNANQGGDLCNLLAKSMINTTVYGDIGLINAGVCKQTLLAPELTAGSIKKAITAEKLMVVEISGADLIDVLTDALGATFGDSGNPELYPYAAGMRYSVAANLPRSERLSNVEVNRGLRGGEWEPIDIRRFYKVVTTEKLASGKYGYDSFVDVIDDWKDPLYIKTGDAFYNYAMKHSNDTTWSELPSSEYSTQYFASETEEAAIATVPNRICHAMIPGQPDSEFCSAADVAHGGEVCNLLSWIIYDQNFGIDMVLLPGKSCAADIKEGKFVLSSSDIVLSDNKSLVTVDVLGSDIVTMINDGVLSAIGNGMTGDYPYAAGLKFDVNSFSVSNIRVITSGGNWIPIVDMETYTVATTSDVFARTTLIATDMGTTMKGEIIKYAEDWGVLYKPPVDKASTQSFS